MAPTKLASFSLIVSGRTYFIRGSLRTSLLRAFLMT